MHLHLIRHGETVDNVANLYAGTRDSELTNHGFQQAVRLGQYLHSTGVEFTHVFSSQLKRAATTAELLLRPQSTSVATNVVTSDTDGSTADNGPVALTSGLHVKQTPVLMEQDFGSYEGKSFLARPYGSAISGKEAHRQEHKDNEDFVDMESKESMKLRADTFLDEYLVPILEEERRGSLRATVAVVSHGILLSVLWRRLLKRLEKESVIVRAEGLKMGRSLDLERLGGWSNTGYLELEMRYRGILVTETAPLVPREPSISTPIDSAATRTGLKYAAPENIGSDTLAKGIAAISPGLSSGSSILPPQSSAVVTKTSVLTGWTTTVLAVNSKQHLVGLKRTGGGVGSARHDANQKSIEKFFKRRRLD